MVCQIATPNVLFGESIAALTESRHAQRRCCSGKNGAGPHAKVIVTMMDAYSRAEALKVRRFSEQALRHNPNLVRTVVEN